MSYAQPVNIETPDPCESAGHFLFDYNNYFDPLHQNHIEWSTESKTMTFCSNLFDPTPDIGNCCYTIVYHDKVIPFNYCDQGFLYLVNITAIFSDGQDCNLRPNSLVVEYFMNQIYDDSYCSNNPNFYPCNCEQGSDLHGLYPIVLFTHSKCYQKDALGKYILESDGSRRTCNDNKYCCEVTMYMTYENNNISKIDSTENQYQQVISHPSKYSDSEPFYDQHGKRITELCFIESQPCTADCLEFNSGTSFVSPCIAPCFGTEFGNWTNQEAFIDLSSCPGCKVKVRYKTRQPFPCPTFSFALTNDIYLDDIEFLIDLPGSTCMTNCPANFDELVYEEVMDRIIGELFITYPDDGFCSDYYRIFQSSCWHHHFREAYPDENEPVRPAERIIVRCGDNDCCHHRYRICNIDDVITSTILESSAANYDCHFYPYPCFYICAPDPE